MKQRIYLSPPDIGVSEKIAIQRAMDSGWVAPLGPEVDAFEAEVSARVGTKFGVATNSGTAALHLALLSVGVSKGDVVLTSTMTFVATANAITYTGAEPIFIDSCLETGNIDVELLREAVISQRKLGRRIGAIVPVDLLGKAVDYVSVQAICDEFDIPLVPDAAESLGSSYEGRASGSWGKVSIVSFNGNKIMTTSGGGMLLTDDETIASNARHLATQAREPFIHYEHSEMGFNYRLSNVLAALGRAQLQRLDSMISRRREIRSRYRDLFNKVDGISLLDGGDDTEDNCWLTSIVVDKQSTGWHAARLSNHLAKSNIESRPLWKPMHLQPLFKDASHYTNGSAQFLFENGLTLPSGSKLTDQEIESVINCVQDILDEKTIEAQW